MSNTVKYSGFSVFLVLGVFVGSIQPFQPALDFIGHATLALLLITTGMWIFKPLNLPFSASGAFFLASLLAIGVPFPSVFSGFSGSAVWTLIPALFFGFVLAKTGLGARVAYFGMKSIKVTYPNLIIMWLIIGVVLSMLTPSITVRVIIITPIALQCVESCKLPEGSKARSLILLTAWTMSILPGTGWLTGSLAGPIISGFFSSIPELGPIDFYSWLRVAMLPMALITVFMAISGYFVLRPTEKLNIGRDVFIEEYKKLGPMSRHEKISAIVLIICFSMFLTSSVHRIPDVSVCLFALLLLSAAGIIDAKEISTGISWDIVLFIGTGMSLGSVLSVTGLSAWLSDIIVDAISPIAGSPWTFIPTMMVFFFLLRFLDIALFIPSMAIISAISPEVYVRYNINPLVWVPLLCIAMNSFLLSYTSIFAIVTESTLGEKGWRPNHLSKFGIVCAIIALISLMLSIPYWISIGMFG